LSKTVSEEVFRFSNSVGTISMLVSIYFERKPWATYPRKKEKILGKG
jgi:hypothetical protein